ncbi:MAG: hypothetical protein ACE5LV_04145 [Candidatus Aminicenantales bacterium]
MRKKPAFLAKAARAGLALWILTLGAHLWCQEKPPEPVWDGSRTTAVHLIPLKDEFGEIIIPSESYPLPYSTRTTCAPCHDYRIIQGGLHFNAGRSGWSGPPGEPWFWVDERAGTVLPVSLHRQENTWAPRDLGLTQWDFTRLFGRHMTGGGISEPEDSRVSPASRWNVSGKLEINCMGCHNASRIQSHSEWAKQVMRENFRWAATAASGLGEVGGMASRLPDTWDLYDGPNPDDTEWAVVPYVRYRKELFDSKHRVFFDIAPRIEDQRCLACHSVTPAGERRMSVSRDVHTSAGMRCVDCHRNDFQHTMIRGYEREADDSGEPERFGFSCRGCHLGERLSGGRGGAAGGHGAPYPRHPGIPPVHFEKMSCTACHAGQLPSEGVIRVRTSRANRLGIYGVARWLRDWPRVIEPVYARDPTGRIVPHRLVWPSFWARIRGEELEPLRPDDVRKAAGDILTIEEDVSQTLRTLALYSGVEGIPVLVLDGRIFRPNMDGLLDVAPFEGEAPEAPVFWGVEKDGQVLPLIPRFDPEQEPADPEAEARIQQVLGALGAAPSVPGTPAVLARKAMYVISEGYLEKRESPEEVPEPLLVWVIEGKIQPLVTGFQARTLKATVGCEEALTEEQVARVLETLTQEGPEGDAENAGYAYICAGRMFRLGPGGELQVEDHPAAAPVLWPLGHQVRPAQQALGVSGCRECHSEGSAFFFNRIEGSGPMITEKGVRLSAHALMELDRPYQKLLGLSFRVRPVLRVVLFVAAVVLGIFVFLFVMIVVGRYSGLLERGNRT